MVSSAVLNVWHDKSICSFSNQDCEKYPAAGKNCCLLGLYQPATLLSISLRMMFFEQNIPELATYFDNSAIYFKTE